MNIGDIITLKRSKHWYINKMLQQLRYSIMQEFNSILLQTMDDEFYNYTYLVLGYCTDKKRKYLCTYVIETNAFIRLSFDLFTDFEDGVEVETLASSVTNIKVKMLTNMTLKELQVSYFPLLKNETRFEKQLKKRQQICLDILKNTDKKIFYVGDKVRHCYYEDVYEIKNITPKYETEVFHMILGNSKETLELVLSTNELELVERTTNKNALLNTVVLQQLEDWVIKQ